MPRETTARVHRLVNDDESGGWFISLLSLLVIYPPINLTLVKHDEKTTFSTVLCDFYVYRSAHQVCVAWLSGS